MTSRRKDLAVDIIQEAKLNIGDRASERDTKEERSMARCVKSFNAMFGKDLTETQGWQFMELLKMARSVGGAYRKDDFVDGASYAGLAGECASQGAVPQEEPEDSYLIDGEIVLVHS